MRARSFAGHALVAGAIVLVAGALAVAARPAPQAPFEHVQFTGTMGGFFAFNTERGDVWGYSWENPTAEVTYLGRITELGKPLELPDADAGNGNR